MDHAQGEVTTVLEELREGREAGAEAKLLALVYSELRRLAAYQLRREREGHTLQPTELVHEAYLRLVRQHQIKDRSHFFALASRVMRRILVDYARARNSARRPSGEGRGRVELVPELATISQRATELIGLDKALNKLAAWDQRQSRIVELRFFGGLTDEEIAKVLDVSVRSVQRDWKMAKAWLKAQIGA